MVRAAFERSQTAKALADAVIRMANAHEISNQDQKPTKSDAAWVPTDTEVVIDKIAAEGNFNEHGGQLGDDDWPVA